MHNNEFFNILRSLSPKEMLQYEDYMNSPLFNKSRKKLEVFEYIKDFYPLFTDIRVEKKAIFEQLYPGKAYNDSTIRNLFSDLHKDVLNFLTIKNFNIDVKNKYRNLINELNYKNLNNEWGNAIERFECDSETGADYNYFLNKHLLAGNKFNFTNLNEKILRENKVKESMNYANNSSVNLVYYFVSEITTNYLNVITYANQFNLDVNNNTTNKLMLTVDFQKILSAIPEDQENKFIIHIYQSLLKMYSDINNESLYFEYKKLFYKNIYKLSKDEISMHYSKLINYCTLKIMHSELSEKFNNELFHLYNTLLENEYYKDSKTNHLPHQLFRSVLVHSLYVKEHAWTNDFIKNYSIKVHPKDIDNMYNYGYANLSFHLGKYSEALYYLQKINPDFLFYKFDVKNITLMVYYEMEYFEEALYLIKTYLQFLRRNRVINSERKKRYLNFIKFTEKLIIHKFGESKQELGYIKYQLSNHKTVAFKSWLLDKISILDTSLGKAV